jgi:hypothetical protein
MSLLVYPNSNLFNPGTRARFSLIEAVPSGEPILSASLTLAVEVGSIRRGEEFTVRAFSYVEGYGFDHNDIHFEARTVAVLTFAEPLDKGMYRLTIRPNRIRRDSVSLDGDGDGVAGGRFSTFVRVSKQRPLPDMNRISKRSE